MSNNNLSLRIRMYRQGLGDCFLLTFLQPEKPQKEFHMMIDCGLLVGTKNGPEIMKKVAADLKTTTGGHLDVVVLTHEHADHISGFTQAQEIFDQIQFGEVWAGWMDDENHPKYKAIRERFHKQVTGLKAALTKMTSDSQQGLKETVTSLVNEFFDENVLGANGSKSGRSPDWDYALKKTAKNKFYSPGILLSLEGVEGIRIYVLGPPENYESFSQVDPPPGETYRQKENSFAIADSFFAAVAGGSGLFDEEFYQPFENHLRIDPDKLRTNPDREDETVKFFQENYGFDKEDPNNWRRIDDDWLTMAGGLALNLDSYTNNTCLALAIEFIESKKFLLFPGDAQFANLISWQNLSWQIPDDSGGIRQITTQDLLNQTIFYKVGHHGSHNATLKKHGLEMMNHPDLMAMIPVDRKKAEKKRWEMPEHNLFETLLKKTQGRVILADEGDDSQLKVRCQDNQFIHNVKFGGESIKDLKDSQQEEPLWVELTIEV
jgi:hypothetical protein